MKNVINKIKNTKGFVSIETIFVVGAFIILAGIIIFFANGKANDVSTSTGAAVDNASTETLKATGTTVNGYDSSTFGK